MEQTSYTVIPYKKMTILAFNLINMGFLALIFSFFLDGEMRLSAQIIAAAFCALFVFPLGWFILFYSLAYVVIDEQGIVEKSYFGKIRRQFTYKHINSVTLLNTGYSFGKAIEIGYIDVDGHQKYIMLMMYDKEIVKFLSSHYAGKITIHPTMEGHLNSISQEALQDEKQWVKENKNSRRDYRMLVVFITWIALAVSVIINFIILL